MNIYGKKINISNDKKKRAMQFSEYLWKTKQHKFIVSNKKHIEKQSKKKSYTALESKYSYRSSKIHLHLKNEMHFRLLKSTAHQKRVL